MVDSGATTSVIQRKHYKGTLTRSDPSMGINGTLTKTYVTTPLSVHTSNNDFVCKHQFKVIPECPVNLLGRDLFSVFQLNITTQGDTLHVTSQIPNLVLVQLPDLPLPVQQSVPNTLWAVDKYDTGLVDCTPYVATLKPGSIPVFHKQYPIPQHKTEAIKPLIQTFLDQGILRECTSPYNTPINPVHKADGDIRFVQDLRAVNAQIVPIAPLVPDVTQLLSSIPSDATHFTVIDLKNAFFSIRVDPQTQPLFAFFFEGRQLTWTRMPQGFIDSPVVFSIVLHRTLQEWVPPYGSVLLQYVDDLLLCSRSGEAAETDGISLLLWLHKEGHKVSRQKVQWSKNTVRYLGFVLSPGKREVSPERIHAVLGLVTPTIKKQMLSFLGFVNFCRAWIPDCSFYDNILRKATTSDAPDTIQWTSQMSDAYDKLKNALVTSPALGLPDYEKDFHLYARENCTTMAGVLAQFHGAKLRPVAFFSKVLPVTVQGMPTCLRSLAACAMLVDQSMTLTLGHPTVLHTTHDVLALIKKLHTQHMSAQRLSGYEVILTSNPNLKVSFAPSTQGPVPILNALLGLKGESDIPLEEHDCTEIIEHETSPRPDLQSRPIPDSTVVFVDGSCSRPNDNTYHAGYAIVSLPDVIHEAKPIPYHSAQAAELIALTRACQLFKDKPVTIYTDSRYAHGVVWDHGVIWQRRGFVGADGKTISHGSLITDLLEALQLPSEIAVLHCRAHTGKKDDISQGNAFADETAKTAAKTQVANISFPVLQPVSIDDSHLYTSLQATATQDELQDWSYPVLQKNPKTGLICKEGRPCIPQNSSWIFIAQFHGVSHNSIEQTLKTLQECFYVTGAKGLVKDYIKRCLTCIRSNPNNPAKPKHQHLVYPTTPFTHLQVDFTHIPNTKGKQEYALVIVDMFSRWPEVFPTTSEDAKTVARILTCEIIPRWGCPLHIESDRGTPFTSKVTQALVKELRIEWKFHIPYHPQSSGIVERCNRTIKDKIKRATGGTFEKWKKVLPIVLADMRMTPSKTTGMSPFEILMGRPFPLPWTRKPLVTIEGDLDLIRDQYVKDLITKLKQNEDKVIARSPSIPQDSTHSYKTGDRVVVQQLHRQRKPGDFPYGEPTRVVAVTRTAVLTDQSPAWIHASRIKAYPETTPGVPNISASCGQDTPGEDQVFDLVPSPDTEPEVPIVSASSVQESSGNDDDS